MRRVCFLTFGCKVNQYETQAMREYFLANGYAECDGAADLYVVNTCTVTSTADRKVLQAIRAAKRENPSAQVVALGCMAEKSDDAKRLRDAGVDLVIPNSRKEEIFSYCAPKVGASIWDFSITRSDQARAFVKVQDGCDNRCAFCKVNQVRGASRSRPYDDVIAELARLSAAGFDELVLCGINLGAWREGARTFVDLLRGAGASGVTRLRLGSVEAPYVTDELIACVATLPYLAKHLHIPFQSGSTEVLGSMHKHAATRAAYDRIIAAVRKAMPYAGISCDIMVGYPTEDEAAFEDTLSLITQAESVRTHIFPYSPRKGTAAFDLTPLHGDVLKERMQRATDAADRAFAAFADKLRGQATSAVFDTIEGDGLTYGYTDAYVRVCADGIEPSPRLRKVVYGERHGDAVKIACENKIV
jgi:threonylcarbamoyladenosine tRNA methylthiotransferase MtaB